MRISSSPESMVAPRTPRVASPQTGTVFEVALFDNDLTYNTVSFNDLMQTTATIQFWSEMLNFTKLVLYLLGTF